MKNYKKYMRLQENEEIIKTVEGDAYNTSANPILRMIGFIVRIISICFGLRRKIHIIITNKRVVLIKFDKFLWVFDSGISVLGMTPRSIHTIGYGMVRSLLIFKTNYFILKTSSENIMLKFVGKKDALYDAVVDVNTVLEQIKSQDV